MGGTQIYRSVPNDEFLALINANAPNAGNPFATMADIGSLSAITVVANFSALPAPGTVPGEFYYVENSQGTRWLPGTLGGTYYVNGLYYSNGVSWVATEHPYQATQAEVNTGTNTDKFLTPKTYNDSDQLAVRVVGPVSATDNAVARYDGTTGKLIQDSLVLIDDIGNISATNFSGSSSGTNSGDNSPNSNSNAYADSKITQTITNGVTTTAPSEDAVFDALVLKQNLITTGTTAQYFRGDLSLATFPTNVSFFTNDAGYLTSLSGAVLTTRTLTINGVTFDLSADRTWTVGDALVANPLSQFAPTTSAQLAGIITDETGSSGVLVFSNAPTLVNPIVGTQTQGDNSTKAASTAYVDTGLATKQPVGNYITALTGDGTASGPGSVALTLATVNGNVGSFGSAIQVPVFTVNAKGLITAVSNTTITPAASSISGGQALTKVDDTNVTMSLGGTPSSALLQAVSMTLGWTGQLSIARGGTGQSTAVAAFDALAPTTTQGDIIYFDGTDNVRLAKDTNATRYLSNKGTSNNPAWSQITLTDGVTGILPLANGGTSKNMTAVNGGVVWTDADSMEVTPAGTSRQVLQSNGAAAPTWVDANLPNAKLYLESPTSSEVDIVIDNVNVARTITRIVVVLVGSSPSVTWTLRKGSDISAAGTEVITGGTTTTNSTTGQVITSFNSASLSANDFLWFETSAKSGTVTKLFLKVWY